MKCQITKNRQDGVVKAAPGVAEAAPGVAEAVMVHKPPCLK